MNGHDAFGISKSFSPTTGYKAITAMSRAERAAIRQPHKGVPVQEKLWQHAYERTLENVKQRPQGVKLRNEQGGHAGTFKQGGKSSGKAYITGEAHPDHVKGFIEHEMQHATPKRSAYRLHRQIAADAGKTMREEGRADYRASGHYKQHKPNTSVYSDLASMRDKAQGLDLFARSRYNAARGSASRHMGAQYSTLDSPAGDKAIGSYAAVHDKMKAAGAKTAGHRGGYTAPKDTRREPINLEFKTPKRKPMTRKEKAIVAGGVAGTVGIAGGTAYGMKRYQDKKS